ncbi:MAG TPA: right-handed parallel beta-helix repeat-containing protein, partial [Candidatus Latescibacteria bacterium]|nr:right-handed parallel beta-helix repeat-containing protein [Candidatus Latescibacterota bacterium]
MPAPQSHLDLYVSPLGRDNWSGRLAEANADDTDGPFATVTKARDTIRELKRATRLPASVTVWLRGGRYILKAPLTFTHADSAPVTYAAFPGETPVLDGGTRITGWQKESLNGKEVWVTTIPEVAEGKWYFRQLFVNGARRSRPRLPKEGFYRVADYERPHAEGPWGDIFMGADAFQCAPGHVQSWKNITDIDIVVIHWWVEERVSMAGFDPATNTVKLANKTGFTLKDDVADGLARYYVENVKEALSDPGEWYLDRSTGKLTYVPMPGEDIETAQVFAPRLRKLVQVTGDADAENYVEFLRFEGLTFEHAEWDYCLSNQAAHKTPAVITFEAARSCAFENCTVRHIGGYAVELRDGCQNIRVVGNTLVDLGAGGVHLNGADALGPRARRTGNNRITDNSIGEGGRVFLAAVGVLSRHSFGNHISHNHIYDLYYSGVS